ncbi:DUF3781 domain-containing protein [uncultured Polaribacter sp.]|uniref:DUF3781 domain-containing protein n=1 Tax=uncultured Polaribacter sp. TaxID=174711 RepID=UPI00262119A8|nr:DUF3781 domain-containing protein [uncultured Polaribacter sp.]
MNSIKSEILKHLCYTELVYFRINKKLKTNLSKSEIEIFIKKVLEDTCLDKIEKIGKNFYVSNELNNIKITVNSNTFRVITVDRILKY